MLNKIISFSIHNKLIIGLFVIGLVVMGIYNLTKLPIDAVPDITDNQVQVITVAPSLGAPDIERLVTFPVEQANSNIPGIKEIRSFSRFGLSLVTIVFQEGVDVYWARQQVAERLQTVASEIPEGVGTPEMGPVTTGLGEIYQYVVRPEKGYEDQYDAMELRTIQDWIVRRQLLGVPGVADVSSFGGYLKQYEIAVDPSRLKSYGLTISDVFTALENNNQNTGGSYIHKGDAVLFIRSEGLLGSIPEIESIAIESTENGTPLYLRDVADVTFGHATRFGAMTYNDEGEVAGAVVMMLKGANSNEVIKEVKSRIAQVQESLPEGVVIEPFLDRTKMVNNAINTVEKNLAEGALIVVFVLVLFLGNLRAGLIVASVIPLAMLFAVSMMNTFGVSGNLMSLGALDFGLIVDGAVIIVEAVLHTFHVNKRFATTHRLEQGQMDETVKESASRMMNSAIFGQIIILIVYLPILTLQGIEGKMFRPMAQTVSFALIGAAILSLTYVPMMSALFLSKKIRHKPTFSDRMMAKIENFYQNRLRRVIDYPKTVITAAVLLFAGALLVLLSLGGEFIPALEEGDFAVDTRVLTGSNLNTTIRSTQQAASILLDRFPEVQKVVTKIGSGEIPTDPMPIEASDMMVILKPKAEWTSAATFDELAEKMGNALQDVPGITAGFQYPVQMRFNELMTGARQDVVCKIFGEDLDTLAHYAQQLGQIATTVEGATDLYVEQVTGMPQIVIKYNHAAIAQHGSNIADINRTVNAAFAGVSSGLIFEGERRFDLVVRLQGELRQNLDNVQNLLVPTPAGQVPLYLLADVNLEEGPYQIQREDAKRRIIVGFNVRGRDVQSIVDELQQKVTQQLTLPPGYYIAYGGDFENLEAARKRLSVAVPISLALIFLLLYFAFRSVRYGLLIYSAIPLSAIGGILALWFRDMPFSISAGVGFIALFGVAVLNGIVMIAEFNRLRLAGGLTLREIVLEGTKTRLRPVLMTASVASLGFLPMALSMGAGAEVQRPLATVVIGGLVVATLLTLFVLPSLYILFEKGAHHKDKSSKAVATMVSIALLLLLPNLAAAQIPITLEKAIAKAQQQNLPLQNERLQAKALEKLQGTAWDIPQTTITGEYGKFNSAYKDTRFSVTQSIKFPTVYAQQKKVLRNEWRQGVLQSELSAYELQWQVMSLYYEMLYAREKQNQLLRTDSLYATFLRNAELRFEKGASNILEKNTAQTQRGQVSQQLKQVQRDIAELQQQFQLLLHTDTLYVPADRALKMDLTVTQDSAAMAAHPYLKVLQQQQEVNQAKTKAEQAQLLPDLHMSYNNLSIKGTQTIDGVERTYTSSDRFSSVELGVGIPIFFGAQKSRIQAARVQEQVAQNSYKAGKLTLETQLRKALEQYQLASETLTYYEQTALPNAGSIIRTADEQFRGGEIDYLEWVLLTNQAITLQTSYLDAVRNYNQSILEIKALTGRN
ncbi:CusA/CzcA family heavy metal efflux RND transporter [Pontibacter anaerobius]|uniref:CusA/CzcA family heavy metal efflux RND transporter n=1 Tax=Pontibacter anaerobius TaxID=2993940 RepID=A0ABT3RCB5_9BACT|nr:CusA/CzcA family heavy metal efflux RND transporter [Pontibacter anaerobius]MCX2739400.1 CusA/CzcA family heavy metal efflux RND transporter [Pontibacter anaerobius]